MRHKICVAVRPYLQRETGSQRSGLSSYLSLNITLTWEPHLPLAQPMGGSLEFRVDKAEKNNMYNEHTWI
jgi:hypothetical protein